MYNFFYNQRRVLEVARQRVLFVGMDKNKRFNCDFSDFNFQLNDNTPNTGFDAHYVYHPAWAARVIAETRPNKHVDISSSLHFCSIVSAFMPVDFYDYRPVYLNLSNLTSMHADLTRLPFADNSIGSISCMHTIEHIGLGRYGDPLDPEGDIKAINELKRVVIADGNLLFVVPIGGIAKIEYNAHRVYTYSQVLSYFLGFNLVSFALVTDDGKFIYNASKIESDEQKYGCGCFYFKKSDELVG